MPQRISFSSISLIIISLMLFVIAGSANAQWFRADHGDTGSLHGIDAFSDQHILAVGDNGSIFSSNDGGENWTAETSPTLEHLMSVSVATDTRIIAVGDSGTILRSTDKGVTWEVRPSPETQNLRAVDMASQNIGTAVGDEGTVLLTQNGGSSWTSINANINNDLNSIWYSNTLLVWAVGETGRIMTSDDSGQTWETRLSGTNAGLNDIVFPSSLNGFIVGDNGTLLKTTNSGTQWASVDLGSLVDGADLLAVDALDENRIVIVGDGVILESLDGGTSWGTHDFSNTDPIFEDIVFYDAAAAWTVGTDNDGGFIDILDESAPAAPSNLVIEGGAETSDSSPSFSWEASPDDMEDITYRVSIEGAGEWDTNLTTFDLPISLASGDYTIEVVAIDEASNESLPVSLDFTIVAHGDGPEPIEGINAGDLIKLTCEGETDTNDPCRAVYYYSEIGMRHAFPNEKVYFTWYEDFDTIVEIDSDTMASISLGTNVTYRPGVKMVKFQSVNTVYVVSADVLRPIASEELAAELYGEDWNQQIDDISDAFHGNYAFGEEITNAEDYSIQMQLETYTTIDQVKGF